MNTFRRIILLIFFLLLFVVTLILLIENILKNNSIKHIKHDIIPLRKFEPLTTTSKLFDLNFKYLINNEQCNVGENLAVILVTSYVNNIETRSAIRRAYPQDMLNEHGIKRMFLTAVSPPKDNFPISVNALQDENRRFRDLIQGDFTESYRNLTYKHMMGVHWAAEYCQQMKYIIKMDDDIVVDVYKIIKFLKYKLNPIYNTHLLAGYVLRGMLPIREQFNKWFVTKKEYSQSFYPPFVSGWFYITTPVLFRDFADIYTKIPYFWIDDVYVTGLLAKLLKIQHFDICEFYTVHPEFIRCCMADIKKYGYECDVTVGPNGGDNNLIVKFSELMKKCYEQQCIHRPENKALNRTCVAERQKIPLGKGKALIKDFKLS